MGRKLYAQNDNGIRFTSTRRPGDVRIPNYVYDMWFPLIGATAMGVYSMYCRLEREGSVKAMSLARIAKMCRIGTEKLEEINDILTNCKFVAIKKPSGHKRLMHWTTEIQVLDPPQEIEAFLIGLYQPPSGYEAMSPWLVSPENLPGFSEEPNQAFDKTPGRSSKIESLVLQPLEVAPGTPSGDFPTPTPPEPFPTESNFEPSDTPVSDPDHSVMDHDDPISLGLHCKDRRDILLSAAPDWAVDASGVHPCYPLVVAFCEMTGQDVTRLKKKKGQAWLTKYAGIAHHEDLQIADMLRAHEFLPDIDRGHWYLQQHQWSTPFKDSYEDQLVAAAAFCQNQQADNISASVLTTNLDATPEWMR